MRILPIVFAAFLPWSCTEQHKPYEDWERFEQERKMANRASPRLTEQGEIPEQPTEGQATEQGIAAKYTTFCASCHGAEGRGDGPAASQPPPRDFSDVAWQNSVDDTHIAKVIKDGGPAVGLSPLMAPWGAVLNDSQLTEMVQLVRSFKGK